MEDTRLLSLTQLGSRSIKLILLERYGVRIPGWESLRRKPIYRSSKQEGRRVWWQRKPVTAILREGPGGF